MEEVIIDFEGRDEECAFFTLYAGLRMYKELKGEQHRGKQTFSIAGAEAHSMLEYLKEKYPQRFAIAQQEYEDVYSAKNLSLSFVSEPVIKWLNDKHHPHTMVTITPTNATLHEGVESTGEVTKYLKD